MTIPKTLLFLIFIATLSCASKYDSSWHKISEGGFSIMMPAQPTKNRKENGATTFRLELNGETYIVTYNLMTTPEENKTDQSLDMVRNGFVNNVSDGTLIEEKRTKINGFAGRELVVESPKNNQVIRQRIVLANSILYQFGISSPKDKQLSDNGQKYLDSFEILSK